MSGDEQGEILMGRWDCGSCGQRGVLGDAYECSSCGAPRPEDVAFYLPEDAEVVTDAAGIAAAEAGPDWQCAFCASWVSAALAACDNCGASQAESERRQKTGEVAASTPEAGRSAAPPRASAPSVPEEPSASLLNRRLAQRERRSIGGLPWKHIAGVGAALFACLLPYGAYLSYARGKHDELIAAQRAVVERARAPFLEAEGRLGAAEAAVHTAKRALRKAQEAVAAAKQDVTSCERELAAYQEARPVEVVEHAWSVRIALEECTAERHEGWDRPSHAFDVQTEQRVHHTERVVDRVETRYREERYRDQDGYDTETYTERIQTGTRRVQSGTRTENLGNGRFRRVPQYRNEPVYENVRKTRQVPRMVWKTRQVPYEETIYRDDPVYRDWYTYQTWRWVSAAALTRTGTGTTILDPEGTPPERPAEALGVKRASRRTVRRELVLRGSEGERNLVVEPGRWEAFAVGDPGRLVSELLLTPDEHAEATALREQRLRAARERVPPLEAKVPPLEAEIPPLEAKVPPLREALVPLRKVLEAAEAKLRELEAARP